MRRAAAAFAAIVLEDGFDEQGTFFWLRCFGRQETLRRRPAERVSLARTTKKIAMMITET